MKILKSYLKLLSEKDEEETQSKEQIDDDGDINQDQEENMENFDDSEDNYGDEDIEYSPKTPEEIGKVFEMKKILYRLIALQSYLSDFADDELYKIRSYIAEAIELFLVISKNIEIFKEDFNDIIVLYYKFLKAAYFQIRRHIEEKHEREKEVRQKYSSLIKSIKKEKEV